jgi:hypothetical protein
MKFTRHAQHMLLILHMGSQHRSTWRARDLDALHSDVVAVNPSALLFPRFSRCLCHCYFVDHVGNL